MLKLLILLLMILYNFLCLVGCGVELQTSRAVGVEASSSPSPSPSPSVSPSPSPSPSPSTIAFVQFATSTENIAYTSTATMTPTSGDLVVAVVYWDWDYGGIASTVTVTDSLNNTWHPLTPSYDPAGLGATQIWYAYNVIGDSSDTFSVTQTTANTPDNEIDVFEYSGVSTTNPLDTDSSQAAQTSTTTLTAGSIDTAGCDLVIAGFFDGGQTPTSDSPSTTRYDDGYPALVSDYILTGANCGQPANISATLGSADNNWSATQAAFLPQQ